ncbi:arylacetamide deacetylase-like [Ptychodera flava]|uniref:arylacetamide deacetylase-like n=1 Tax=Ptychodera flava TaxID=63121 RepID=UPI00396A0500
MGKILKGFAILGVVIAFFLYTPRPYGMAESGRVTFFNAAGRTVRFTGYLLQYLGITEEYKIQRHFLDMAHEYTRKGRPETTDLNITNTKFDGVSVRIYEPLKKEVEKMPAVVFIHGGGWSTLSVENYDDVTTDLARLLGQVVLISVDYNLAPEHPFPEPMDECYRATKWLLDKADDYGVDANRVAIVGDSAGGNLATSVALQMKFNKVSPPLKMQALIYPCLQPLDFTLPSYQQNNYAFDGLINTYDMTKYWLWYAIGKAPRNLTDAMYQGHFLRKVKTSSYSRMTKYIHHGMVPEKLKESGYYPVEEAKDYVNYIPESLMRVFLHPYFSPLLADDLSGLPYTYVLTAQFDVLRDEGILYAKRLKKAGVNVGLNNVPDGFHGMLNLGFDFDGFEIGKRIRKDVATVIRNKL